MFAAVTPRPSLFPRVKLMILAALLVASLGFGMTATTQKVDARPATKCVIIDDPDAWFAVTGYKADPDFVGGMVCNVPR
jgi:hypothetical protein